MVLCALWGLIGLHSLIYEGRNRWNSVMCSRFRDRDS